MKKEETTQVEEEKKLIWKLKDLPNADSIASLVDTKVITPQEARDILFRKDTKQSDEVEALKEMVKSLQELVKDLLLRQDRVQFVPYTKIVEVPARTKPYWDKYWTNGVTYGNTMSTASSTCNGNSIYTLSLNQ